MAAPRRFAPVRKAGFERLKEILARRDASKFQDIIRVQKQHAAAIFGAIRRIIAPARIGSPAGSGVRSA
jgi:hypothetical protein